MFCGHNDLNRVEKEDGVDEARYPRMTKALFGEGNVVGVQLGDFKAVQRPVEQVAEKLVSFVWVLLSEMSLGGGTYHRSCTVRIG